MSAFSSSILSALALFVLIISVGMFLLCAYVWFNDSARAVINEHRRRAGKSIYTEDETFKAALIMLILSMALAWIFSKVLP